MAEQAPTTETPQIPATSSRDADLDAEQWAVAAILAALGLVLTVFVVKSRWSGETPRLERLPRHRLDYRIDVNKAGAVELMHLPGIGPALAERIIQDRTDRGPFRSVEDLQRVKGIGPKLSEQMAPYLRWRTNAAQPPQSADGSDGP